MRLRTINVWGDGRVRWDGKAVRVENGQRCEEARIEILELAGCKSESWLCQY